MAQISLLFWLNWTVLLAHFFILFVLPSSLTHAVEVVKDLKQIHIIMRHGDRAPLKRYKNDAVVDAEWPEPQSDGTLTTLGVEQQYAEGKYFRERYAQFLTPGKERSEVYLLASDHSRALESAAALAAGFFPPLTGSSFWHADNIDSNHVITSRTKRSPLGNHTDYPANTSVSDLGSLWRPMAIHTVPKDQEAIWQQTNCPKITRLNSDLYHAAEGVFGDRASVGRLLQKNAADAGTTFWERAIIVSDSLECLGRHNRSLPKWIDPKSAGQLKVIADWLVSRYYGYSPTATDDIPESSERARLTGGPLLTKIIHELKNSSQSTKMFVYTGHDTAVGSLYAISSKISAESKKSAFHIPFNTAIIIELFKNDSVRVLYRAKLSETATESETIVYDICNTGSGVQASSCPLISRNHLVEVTARWTNLADWTSECYVHEEDHSYPSNGAWATMIILMLLIGLIFGVRWYRRRKLSQKAATAQGTHPDPVVSYRTLDNHGF